MTATVAVESHYTPVPDEIDAFNLVVEGALPPELTGRYLRNGPNPRPGAPLAHPFVEPGMVHGVRLKDGEAQWYRNRWVRTSLFNGTAQRRPDGVRELSVCYANTHVIEHAGRIFALVESGLPHELSPELDTIGPYDFAGRLTTAMTAHPKTDPLTGELHFFGYGVRPPFLTYHRLSPAGELVHSAPVEVPGPTMMHDFAITEDYIVWLDLPVVFDQASRGVPYRWSDEYGARIGLMPQKGGPVQWFEVEPCYVFHVGNARQDAAGRVILDAVRYDRTKFRSEWDLASGAGDPAKSVPGQVLHRWTLDPRTGAKTEAQLDDWSLEFPTLNENHVGRQNRYLYLVGGSSIVKFDTVSAQRSVRLLPEGSKPGEAVFVPAENGRAEDDGWLLTIVSNRISGTSDLLVLDATDVCAKPVATVHLPRWVPAGFHGSWIPDGVDR
jgi:carotenoid cleavage dioxygenase